jgi:hypothetical protein
MGRVSTAVEVVMAAPQAVSLAVGSMLVVVLSYRTIFAVMAAVTAVSAAYVAVTLRHQIAGDVRRPLAEGPDAVGTRTEVVGVRGNTEPSTGVRSEIGPLSAGIPRLGTNRNDEGAVEA